ncbi:peroxisomal membrane protein 4 isoform 1-T1 [Ciconia maguari]
MRALGGAPPPEACALPAAAGPGGRCAMAGSGDALRALLRAANALLQQRRYRAALAVLKGFRNGAVYGAKIRAPHALVMTFLFKSGSLREKLKSIAKATYIHSRNLAYFVFTYKGLMALQSQLQGKKIPFHSFFAACIGGWLVFGENNPINSQIIMYLLSRILFGLSRLAVEKGYVPQPKQDPFPLVAALEPAAVLEDKLQLIPGAGPVQQQPLAEHLRTVGFPAALGQDVKLQVTAFPREVIGTVL